jgi:hypothetical protein
MHSHNTFCKKLQLVVGNASDLAQLLPALQMFILIYRGMYVNYTEPLLTCCHLIIDGSLVP